MSVRFDAALDVATYATGAPSSTTFTVCGWINIATNSNVNQCFWSNSNSQSAAYFYLGLDGSGKFLDIYTGAGGSEFTGSTDISAAGVWRHVALVKSGTSWTGYLNGVSEIATFTATAGTLGTASTVFHNDFDNDWFNGSMYLWRSWDSVALTPTQIAQEYASQTVVNTTGLYSNYPFVDGASAANDISGNGRNLGVLGLSDGPANPPFGGSSGFRHRPQVCFIDGAMF